MLLQYFLINHIILQCCALPVTVPWRVSMKCGHYANITAFTCVTMASCTALIYEFKIIYTCELIKEIVYYIEMKK